MNESEERLQLLTTFNWETNLRKRILIKRQAQARGYTDLADLMTRNLVPEVII